MLRQDHTRTISITCSNNVEVNLSGIARTALAAPPIRIDETFTSAGGTLSAAPPAGTTNEFDHIVVTSLANANTIEIKSAGGAATTHDFYGVLQLNETAEYTHGSGWATFDAAHQEKVTLTATAGNFTVGGNLTVAGTLGVTGASTLAAVTASGLITANAGITIPTGQSITGAGTAKIDGFSIGSATPGAGAFTTLSASGLANLSGGGIKLGTNHLSYGGTAAGLSFDSSNNATFSGFVTAASGVFNGGSVPSVSASAVETGVYGGSYPRFNLIDANQSANNRVAHEVFAGGILYLQFANDAQNAFTSWAEVTGGQGSGVTGIAFKAPVAVTGALSSTGNLTLSSYGTGGGLVSVGAADSGGTGYKVLRVPN
jgi:hypothetical protein